MDYRKIDMSLYDKFRNLLQERNDLFKSNLSNDEKIILCVLADRLKHAIEYINDCNGLLNKSFNVSYYDEYQFYSYFVACNTIVETITRVNKVLKIKQKESLKFFIDDIKSFTNNIIDKDYNDKKFFNHIRALIFHPTDADRKIPWKLEWEIQYSWDISVKEWYICLHIWSNVKWYFEWRVSINNLQNYIIEEYNKLEWIINFIEDFKWEKNF